MEDLAEVMTSVEDSANPYFNEIEMSCEARDHVDEDDVFDEESTKNECRQMQTEVG